MRDKVAKVCLSLVLACTFVVSPFVKAEKAYAVVPAVAAAASAWGVSEGAVVAAVSAMAAACGVALVGQTETGTAWPDYVNSPDDLFALWETQDILEAASEQNGGGYDPKKNNGGGNFLECVKQLATVGAITGVGSAVNAGVNFLLDQLFPLPGSDSSPVFSNSSTLLDVDFLTGSLPPGVVWDDTKSWYGAKVFNTPQKITSGGVTYTYNSIVAYNNETANLYLDQRKSPLYWYVTTTTQTQPVGTYYFYDGGEFVFSTSIPSSINLVSDSSGIGYINSSFQHGFYVRLVNSSGSAKHIGNFQNGVYEGEGQYSNTTKLDSQYEIANVPADLLASINAAAAAANNAADRSQALADATQAVLDNLASTGSSIQTTPSTSNDRDDYVTTEPTVKPVEPTEPVDPDAPFDWNQFLQPDLYLVFPFCLPWDIYQVVSLLSSSAEAPVFDLPLKVPVEGGEYKVHIDLSVFDPVAEVIRAMELLAVAAGLIFLTKKMIEN